MAIQPIYESLKGREEKINQKERFKSCVKTDIKSAEIAKTLFLSARIFPKGQTVEDGKISFNGKTVFYLVYLSQEGEVVKREVFSDYNYEFINEKIEKSDEVTLFSKTVKSYSEDGGEYLTLCTDILSRIEVYSEKETPCLLGGDGIIELKGEEVLTTVFPARTIVYPVEEEFDFSYPVEKVLFQKADAIILSAQCGVGSVILDGEIHTAFLLLPKSEKGDIIRENKTFPFRIELECEEAMPSLSGMGRCEVSSFSSDLAVDEEDGKTFVTLRVSVVAQGEAIAKEEKTLIKDLFSITDELAVEKKEVKFCQPIASICESFSIVGRGGVPELDLNDKLVCVLDESADLVSITPEAGKIKIEGVVTANLLMKNSDGKYFTVKCETAFEKEVEGKEDSTVNLWIKGVFAKIISLTEIELSIEARICLYSTQTEKVVVLCKVEEVCPKEVNQSAISVYFPLRGEELWSLAKRLNVCPDDLIITNPELQFPLSGEERIVVYRELKK